MDTIVYIDGKLADKLGRIFLQTIADTLAAYHGQQVSLLTSGQSDYHGHTRVVGNPASMTEAEARKQLNSLASLTNKESI